MNPIRLTSPVYRVKKVANATTSGFYKNITVDTLIRFELKTEVFNKTTNITVYNLSNNTKHVSPAHRVRQVFWRFTLEEIGEDVTLEPACEE